MRITREFWWTAWGVWLGFTMQVGYDVLGLWIPSPSWRTYSGAIVACISLLILLIVPPKEDKANTQTKSN